MSRTTATRPIHKQATLGDIHPIPNASFVDIAARDAIVNFELEDVGMVCQVGNDIDGWLFYVIKKVDAGVATWESLKGGLDYFLSHYTATGYSGAGVTSLQFVGTTDASGALCLQYGGAFMITNMSDDLQGRGFFANDFQRVREDSSQIASGEGSVILGGQNCKADANYSQASGFRASAFGIEGRRVYSPKLQINVYEASAQTSHLTLGTLTFNNTPRQLYSGDDLSNTTEKLILQNNQAITFTGKVIAKQTGSTTNIASWLFQGCIVRGADAASTIFPVAPTITTISNAPGWTLALTVDTTNGGLSITFTGHATEEVRCLCEMETVEVIFA